MHENFSDRIRNTPQGKTYLFFAGQAGFIIKSSSGELLAIDLYLSNCVERLEGHIGYKRLVPQILFDDEIVFDHLITTHAHLDHYDEDSVPNLLRNLHTSLHASEGCRGLIENSSIQSKQVDYIKPGDTRECGDFSLRFLCCDHGTAAPDAVGVIVEVDGKRILETGDTCLRMDWVDKYKAYGEIDVLIAPINGAYGNMNEQEFALLADAIKPRIAIPCHFGMFASHGGDPGLFMEIMNRECPLQKYLLMTPGERLLIRHEE